MENKTNYGIMVNAEEKYPVNYTVKQNGEKVFEETFLLGKDLTENQIKELSSLRKKIFDLTVTKIENREVFAKTKCGHEFHLRNFGQAVSVDKKVQATYCDGEMYIVEETEF